MGTDESIDTPVTLKMSDIEHQPEGSLSQDAMPIDEMGINEESNASGGHNVAVANNVVSDEEQLEIESVGSSELYAGMSSSESSTSRLEEVKPTPKLPEKQARAKAKVKVKASNQKIVSQLAMMAAVENIEVAKDTAWR